MNRLNVTLAVVVSLILVAGAVYRFDFSKVSKKAHAKFVAEVSVELLEIQRRNLVQRIHDIEKAFRQTYHQRLDYKEAIQALKLLDMKLKALYQQKGS